MILCSRSVKNGVESIAAFKTEHPHADITVMQLDLGSFKSVYTFADAYKASGKPLNILINNAGIMGGARALTAEGIESQFGINHIGHFLLTSILLPLLKASGTKQSPSRVVSLASSGNYIFNHDPEGIRFDDLKAEKSFKTFERYGQSKLANVLFARELNRRMETEQTVIAVSVHPGNIAGTNLSSPSLSFFVEIFKAMGSVSMVLHAFNTRMKSVPEGAATTLMAALSPSVVPGAHYADCQISSALHVKAGDQVLWKRLWEVSEDIVAKGGL